MQLEREHGLIISELESTWLPGKQEGGEILVAVYAVCGI